MSLSLAARPAQAAADEFEQVAEALKLREKVTNSQQDLIDNGTPLEYTRFDMDLATDFQLNVPPRSEISKMLDEAFHPANAISAGQCHQLSSRFKSPYNWSFCAEQA